MTMARIARRLCQAWWERMNRNQNGKTKPAWGFVLSSLPSDLFQAAPFFGETKHNLYISQVNLGRCLISVRHARALRVVCLSSQPTETNSKLISRSSLGGFLLGWKTYLHTVSLCRLPTCFSLEKEKDCRLEVNSDRTDEIIRRRLLSFEIFTMRDGNLMLQLIPIEYVCQKSAKHH